MFWNLAISRQIKRKNRYLIVYVEFTFFFFSYFIKTDLPIKKLNWQMNEWMHEWMNDRFCSSKSTWNPVIHFSTKDKPLLLYYLSIYPLHIYIIFFIYLKTLPIYLSIRFRGGTSHYERGGGIFFICYNV